MLEGLLQHKMPTVSKHLRKRDVDLIAVVPQWFLSLFSQDFPFEVRATLSFSSRRAGGLMLPHSNQCTRHAKVMEHLNVLCYTW